MTTSCGPKSILELFWGAVAYPPSPANQTQPDTSSHIRGTSCLLLPPPLQVGLLDMGAAMQEGDPGKGAQLSRN